MKQTIAIITVVLQITSANAMAEETVPAHEAKQMLEQIIKQLPRYSHVLDFAENYRGWKRFPEFKQLENFTSKNWEAVLSDIEGAAPSDTHLFILFTAFQSLPQEDYFACLNRLADLCLSKTIDKEMFKMVWVSYEVKTRNAMSLNYKKPAVIEIARKAKTVFADDPHMLSLYDGILSGDAQKALEEYWSDGPETPTLYPSAGNAAEDVGLAIVRAAREQVGKTVKYDTGYVPLDYPMGDLPLETGACADVIVRALRDALGMDLQELVHKDMRTAFLLYPNRRGIRLPDKSIDHRRVLNLKRYFKRKGFSVPVTDNMEDYLPGDIIANEIHIMIVSDRKTEQGIPLIIHNIGRGAQEETGLNIPDITGHYRMTHKGKQSWLNNNIVFAVVVLIATILGWRYFRKKGK